MTTSHWCRQECWWIHECHIIIQVRFFVFIFFFFTFYFIFSSTISVLLFLLTSFRYFSPTCMITYLFDCFTPTSYCLPFIPSLLIPCVSSQLHQSLLSHTASACKHFLVSFHCFKPASGLWTGLCFWFLNFPHLFNCSMYWLIIQDTLDTLFHLKSSAYCSH